MVIYLWISYSCDMKPKINLVTKTVYCCLPFSLAYHLLIGLCNKHCQNFQTLGIGIL